MKETIYGLSSATWAYKRRGGEWDQQNPWALVSRAEREQGDGKHWYVCCDTPAGFSTLQTKHSAATRQILALFQGNKQKNKTVYSNHSVKAARNLNSSLFLLPCSDISGMKEKNFFPKGKSLKVLRLQKHLFLPFLPALPSEEPFSQESRSLLVPIAGARCFSTQWGKSYSRGCKGCWWHTFSRGADQTQCFCFTVLSHQNGWPVGQKSVKRLILKKFPSFWKQESCALRPSMTTGQWPLQVPFPCSCYILLGGNILNVNGNQPLPLSKYMSSFCQDDY